MQHVSAAGWILHSIIKKSLLAIIGVRLGIEMLLIIVICSHGDIQLRIFETKRMLLALLAGCCLCVD